MAVFTWLQDFGGQKTTKPRVSNIKFGDGYIQRVAHGINTRNESWSLTFGNRDQAETQAIIAFLEARNGVESFDWTPPDTSVAAKYICQDWSIVSNQGLYFTIQASFERVFEP